ncbi:transcriptional repressor [Salicibibacter cibi]|uniref:Transcriptional repressor n=1 Tax=Salicibibacter cibi TaxID=2743001 RepID=A0A7T6ZDI5_9BACI|nr:transcriptional repressor [Salicibibacter cibi]QQK81267.1 transcriptional repressor [Salicibibacter cibi]
MSAKAYHTPQRQAVYEVIRESGDHPTAVEIMDRLRKRGQNFAYGTIYNSLRYLVDAEYISELKLGDNASRYDANIEDHHHITCMECGKIDEVYADLPKEWLDAVAQETNYAVDKPVNFHHVVLKGVCADCRGK